MKALVLMLGLYTITFAQEAPTGPGAQKEKGAIIDQLREAEKLDPKIAPLRTAYTAVRNNPDVPLETKYTTCKAYYDLQTKQDELFYQAIVRTEVLYSIPLPALGKIKIGMPDDPLGKWTAGLTTAWNPKVLVPDDFSKRSGEYVIRAQGSDAQSYFLSIPTAASNVGGWTEVDGEVFILRKTIENTLSAKNPGVLGAMLYHELRHFEHLSHPHGSKEEEERDTWEDENNKKAAFGLSKTDNDAIESTWHDYERLAKTQHTGRYPDKGTETLLAMKYDQQINLAQEYAELERQMDEKLRPERERDQAWEADHTTVINNCGFVELVNKEGKTVGFSWNTKEPNQGYDLYYKARRNQTSFEFRAAMEFAAICAVETVADAHMPKPAGIEKWKWLDSKKSCYEDGDAIIDKHWKDANFRKGALEDVIFDMQNSPFARAEARCMRYLHDHWKTHMTKDEYDSLIEKTQKEYTKTYNQAEAEDRNAAAASANNDAGNRDWTYHVDPPNVTLPSTDPNFDGTRRH